MGSDNDGGEKIKTKRGRKKKREHKKKKEREFLNCVLLNLMRKYFLVMTS